MTKQMYCVACPLGCFITVEYDDTGILNVTKHKERDCTYRNDKPDKKSHEYHKGYRR